jgi:hypothetical protein
VIFLNGVLLGLLAAAGIPLLIHLLNPRQRRQQPLSTLRFLKAIRNTRLRNLRVRRWLLLALRTLIVILLVLAFARPAVRHDLVPGAGREAVSGVLLFDNSLSSRGADDGQEVHRRQLDQLRALLEAGTPQDRYSLLLLARPVRWLTPTPVGAGDLLGLLPRIEPAYSSDDLRGGLELARERLQQGGLLRELHLFSDGRIRLEGDSLATPLPRPLAVYWHRADSPAPGVPLPLGIHTNTLILKEGVPVELACTLALPEGDRGGSLSLERSGVPMAHREREPGENPALLRFAAPQPGEHALVIRAGGPEGGELGQRRTVLSVPERIPVLLVAEPGAAGDATAAALRPGEAYGRAIALARITGPELETRNLADTGLVVVLGPERLSSAARHSLATAVEQGLGLVLIPDGPDPDLAALGRFTVSLGLPAVAGLRGPGNWRLAPPDTDHPLFRGVLEPGRDFSSPRIERVLELAGSDSLRALLSLTDGSPLLVERRLGSGRVLLLASAPDARWSDLAHSGLFPALCNRLCYYLGGVSGKDTGALVCGLGARLEDRTLPPGELELVGPDGSRLLPPAGRGARALPPLERPGFYALLSGGDTLRTLAVNPAHEDLVSAPLDAQALEHWAGIRFDNPPADLRDFGDTRRGREIWRGLLIAAALLMALEAVLAMGRTRPSKENEA